MVRVGRRRQCPDDEELAVRHLPQVLRGPGSSPPLHEVAHDGIAHCRGNDASPARGGGGLVSNAVGYAVTRNRVKRRARAWAAQRLTGLGEGDLLVIRALPAAADADYPALERSLDRALAQAT